jgi:hypothetical protein
MNSPPVSTCAATRILRLARPPGIELHRVTARVGILGELEKRSSSPGARVQYRRQIRREVEKLSEARSLVRGKRVVADRISGLEGCFFL